MTAGLKTLLIAVDLQRDRDEYLTKVRELAKTVGANVSLVFVEEELPLLPYFSSEEKEDPEFLKTKMADLKNSLEAEGIEVSGTHIKSGIPHRVICELGAELAVSAIVIGLGINFPEKKSIGSVAEKVIRKSEQHVLVINDDSRICGNVLCAYDFSPCSLASVKLAERLSVSFRHNLSLLHVINKIYFSSSPSSSTNSKLGYYEKIEKIEHMAAQGVKESVEGTIENVSGIEILIKQGIPSLQICKSIIEEKIDWLVIGASGHNAFVHLFLGSTVEDVIRKGTCNIFVYKKAIG